MSFPDIVFIVLDTQRADRLGCFGNKRAFTPNLDRFAAGSVLFEQAVSPAQWTIPSHASMFTGHYPTTHGVTQSSHSLSPDLPHLVELLKDSGYETTGFCNNPLVGILNNGFKRGFQTFYNYGGAIPSLPQDSSSLPWPFNRIVSRYTQFLRRISYPIQNFFGQSDLAFRLSLNAWFTPLWSKFANFKGQNERSVRDISHYLRQREDEKNEKPMFLFLNLMETHLPFWPPAKYIDRAAPYYRDSKEAMNVIQNWNREAFRWGAPLAEPLGELEAQVLSDFYDAEVAYQDDYLGELFDVLEQRANKDNTLTIIVSDHGDGLGEHGYFGHAFVAYEELIHVPLMMKWPQRLPQPARVSTPVSTRRVFHTILDAVGNVPELPNFKPAEAGRLSLMHAVHGVDPENGTAYSEVYPPLNFLRAIENHWPELIEPFRCDLMRRAVVKEDGRQVTCKLIQVDNQPDELFSLTADPAEAENLITLKRSEATVLNQQLNMMAAKWARVHEELEAGEAVEVEDEQLLQQLRGLGYID